MAGSPTFFGEGHDTRMGDTKWGLWQKILGTEIDGNNPFIPPTDLVQPEGDNYRFTFDGDFYQFNLRDRDGNAYSFNIIGAPGSEEIRLTSNPDPVVVGIVPNLSAQSYQFTHTNFMRFINVDDFVSWHTVSALLDSTLLISDAFASDAANSTDSNTYNAIFLPPEPSFYFRYIPTGARFKPWVVLDAGNPMIELTAI